MTQVKSGLWSLPQLQTLWLLPDPCVALTAAPTSLELAQAVQSLLETLAPARDPSTVAFFLQKQLALHGLAMFVAHHGPCQISCEVICASWLRACQPGVPFGRVARAAVC